MSKSSAISHRLERVVFCASCSTKHQNILMFLVMICTLRVLMGQIIVETDEDQKHHKNSRTKHVPILPGCGDVIYTRKRNEAVTNLVVLNAHTVKMFN